MSLGSQSSPSATGGTHDVSGHHSPLSHSGYVLDVRQATPSPEGSPIGRTSHSPEVHTGQLPSGPAHERSTAQASPSAISGLHVPAQGPSGLRVHIASPAHCSERSQSAPIVSV